MLITKEFIVSNPTGLHARPASQLVQTAHKFESSVTLESNGKSINAKSMIKLLAGGVTKGNTVKITCEGSDENQSMAAITELFDKNFDENFNEEQTMTTTKAP
jgi:phosphocarrier protein